MDFIIRNKWLTLRGGSYVKDINEKDVRKVVGKFFTFTRKYGTFKVTFLQFSYIFIARIIIICGFFALKGV